MKKPDRWERAIKKKDFRLHCDAPWLVKADDAIELLRKEHRWVERMVLKEFKSHKPQMDAYGRHCMALQARDILAKLKERVK